MGGNHLTLEQSCAQENCLFKYQIISNWNTKPMRWKTLYPWQIKNLTSAKVFRWDSKNISGRVDEDTSLQAFSQLWDANWYRSRKILICVVVTQLSIFIASVFLGDSKEMFLQKPVRKPIVNYGCQLISKGVSTQLSICIASASFCKVFS